MCKLSREERDAKGFWKEEKIPKKIQKNVEKCLTRKTACDKISGLSSREGHQESG